MGVLVVFCLGALANLPVALAAQLAHNPNHQELLLEVFLGTQMFLNKFVFDI